MQIETINITDLQPDPKNARKHDETNLKAIKASLSEFGQRKPIVITDKNVVVAGNGTLAAARALGWDVIDAVRVPAEWTANQIKAFALADNRTAELADWDREILSSQLFELQTDGWDISLIGFDVTDLPTKPADEADDVIPEPPAEPKSKLGDVWLLGRHRLMCGDSTDASTIAKLMDGKKADLVLTDPPFGNGITGSDRYGRSGLGTRTILGDGDTKIIENVFPALDSALKDNTHCLVWIQWRTFSQLEAAFKQYRLRTVVIWDKKSHGLGSGIVEQYEMLCVFIKGKATQNEFVGNVWSISREHGTRENMEHPHKKPIEVLVKALNLTSQPKDLVLDLFGGSGSTLIACEQTNRTCYMMELDPQYVDVIITRWEALTGQTAVLQDNLKAE